MNVLIIAEHDNRHLKSVTRRVVTAALQFSPQAKVSVLVAGYQCALVAEQAAKLAGVDKVWVADDSVYEHALAENLSELIVELSSGFQAIIAGATSFGKDLMPRIAAMLDVPQVSDVIKLITEDTFERPVYAGNAIAQVRNEAKIKLLTIRPSAFANCEIKQEPAQIEELLQVYESKKTRFIKSEINRSVRPSLASAKVVVSGGRGLQNAHNFKLIESLADKLGAAIGASRAAVDAGFISNDFQIGQTGKIVAPDLYIAIGISGAVQHLAGMKESKVIVAINKDPDAPIFQVANYGLVGDLFTILPELEAEIDKVKSS